MLSADKWDTLCKKAGELPADTIFLTPLSRKRFLVTEVRESKITIRYPRGDETELLQRDKFETLFERVMNAPDEFDVGRLPPNAEPYATVLSLHPRVLLDEQEGTITDTEIPTDSPLVDVEEETTGSAAPTNQGNSSKEISVSEMLSKMGSPAEKIECPITDCNFTDRSAESVAAHVSSSSTAKHIWSNTPYSGWRDFVRTHE